MKTHQRVSFRAACANLHRLSVSTAGLLLCVFATGCPQVVVPPPPPPPAAAAKIASAKTVFISNLGSDRVAALNLPGGANGSYDQFYASLQQWGQFHLVASPTGADLVFEIRSTMQPMVDRSLGTNPVADRNYITEYPAIISLTIRDPADQSLLWSTEVKFLNNSNGPKGEKKQFGQVIEGLTTQLKALVPSGIPTAMPTK